MRLLIIRHPEPIGAEGICYGVTDLDISAESLDLCVEKTGPLLAGLSVDLWLSSPRQRALKLAQALSDSVVEDSRLSEMSFGDWEGMSWDDIDREAFDAWSADYVNNKAPGGESFGDVLERIAELLADLKSRELETVAIVTHAGVIRAFLSKALEVPVESTWHFQVGFGALITLDIGKDDWQNRLVALTPLAV